MTRKPFFVLVTAAIMAITACAPGASTPSATTATSAAPASAPAATAAPTTAAPKVSLTVAALVDAGYAQLFIAKNQGYFDAENLDVKITVGAGSNILPQVVSRQADIGFLSMSSALLAAKQGQDTAVIYSMVNASLAAYVWGKAGIKSINECARMGSGPAGSGQYSAAAYYKKTYSAKYDIVPINDIASTLAQLTSGAIDCANGPYQSYQALADKGTISLIVDPRKAPEAARLLELPSGSAFGLTENLRSKKDAIVRFVRAYHKALTNLRNDTPEQIAAILKKGPDWAPVQADLLAQSVVVNRSTKVYAPNDGFIPESIWQPALQFFKDAGNAVEPSDPVLAYDKRTDFSYYKTATGK